MLVSNLPDHRITPDVLFTLFGGERAAMRARAELGVALTSERVCGIYWSCSDAFPLCLCVLCRSVYGDVIRVKILFNKRDTAMIQFATAQQAYLATLHLNHLQVYEKEINVSPSKHTEVHNIHKHTREHMDTAQAQWQRHSVRDYTVVCFLLCPVV